MSESMIDILVPENDVRSVHRLLARQLVRKGHDAVLVGVAAPGMRRMLDRILSFERKVMRIRSNDLLERIETPDLSRPRAEAALRIDMSGTTAPVVSPTLLPGFIGCASLAGAARQLMSGRPPDIEIMLDGKKCIARGAPMVDSRLSVVRGLNDVLARVVTLLVDTADNYLKGRIRSLPPRVMEKDILHRRTDGSRLRVFGYAEAGQSVIRRLGYHVNSWEVSYRFHDGQKVAATGLLGEARRRCPMMAVGFMPTRLRSNGRSGISSSWRIFVTVAKRPSSQWPRFSGTARRPCRAWC